MPRLTRAFFDRSPLEVAPELIGCHLVHELDGVRVEGMIVEVEAYLGDGSDPASHAHRGPTPRNASMFGPPGRFYVYRSHGIHACINVVCEAAGRGAGVLLRAAAPRAGHAEMTRRRGGRDGREACSGPGKLTQAFGIGLHHDGSSALRGPLRLAAGPGARAAGTLMAGPRIGISRAARLPYRFFLDGCPHVTRSPLNRRARRVPPIIRSR